MVVDHQVVVDGLGDVDAAERGARPARFFAQDAQRIRGIVAADVEKRADAVRLQHPEDVPAVFQIRLVAGGAERRAGGSRDPLQVPPRFPGEIEEVLVDDAAHTVPRAVDPLDARLSARLQRGSHQRFVDNGGGTAALGDQNLSLRHGISLVLWRP